MQIFLEQRQSGNALDQEIAGAAAGRRRAIIIGDADRIFRGSAADRHWRVGLIDLADDAVGDGFGHAPPADDLDAEGGKCRRFANRRAPEPELVLLRNLVLQQRLHAKRNRRGPGAAVLGRDIPEPAGGKPRLDHAGGADPQARQHRIGQRIGVEQRQIRLVHVAGMQVLMRCIDLGAPQRIGVGPEHRLRAATWCRRYIARCMRRGDRWRGAAGRRCRRIAIRNYRRVAPAGLARVPRRHRAKSPPASAGLGNAPRPSRRKQGCVIAAIAPQWPAKYSISAGAERVLVVTAMAPSSTQANQASMASMQLSRWIRTNSPGLTPRAARPAASAPTRS